MSVENKLTRKRALENAKKIKENEIEKDIPKYKKKGGDE